MTRAMRRLFLTYAEVRRLYGEEHYTRPSRFIREVPAEFIEGIRLRGGVSQPAFHGGSKGSAAPEGLRLGQRVMHPKFGEGVLLAYEGQGAQARVQVNFTHVGSKWLVLAYANLEAV
jgi:DNA helicase-2/ATP-dependent DNA helicase PcrA